MTRGSPMAAGVTLPDSHWRRYPPVHWPAPVVVPSGGALAAAQPDLGRRIEEVVVGPSGVHVVLASPAATVSDPDVGTAARAAAAVAALLPPRYRDRVRPELRLHDDAGDVATWHEDVLLASPRALEHVWRYGPRLLSTSEIAEVSRWLDARLEPVVEATPAASRRWWLRWRRVRRSAPRQRV